MSRTPQGSSYSYHLVISEVVGSSNQSEAPTQSETPTSDLSDIPTTVSESSQNVRPATSRNIRHTKEIIKENNIEKETTKEEKSAALAADGDVAIPLERIPEVSEGIAFYFAQTGRKKFRRGNAHKDAIVGLILEVGLTAFNEGVVWAAKNGISNINSLETRCRNVAKGVTQNRFPTAANGRKEESYGRGNRQPPPSWIPKPSEFRPGIDDAEAPHISSILSKRSRGVVT